MHRSHSSRLSLSSELPTTTALGAARLRSAIAGLEEAEQNAKQENRKADVTSYSYVRGVLVAAINLHEFYSEQSGSQAGVHPAAAPSAFAQCASGDELDRLVQRLQAEMPPSVTTTFPNFRTELEQASKRPPAVLRAAAARLDAAYADVACRLNTEASTGFAFPPLGGQSPLHLEAQALAF